ncbi:hypothetical protein Scep_005480 [Stephania cephalantha]|uniref:Uncharacterized protein n=1 Tax=Stephania cephalantha TaxID=152367 RepID=A0AAP0Q051_9MAGN
MHQYLYNYASIFVYVDIIKPASRGAHERPTTTLGMTSLCHPSNGVETRDPNITQEVYNIIDSPISTKPNPRSSNFKAPLLSCLATLMT